jgi:murein DD-endopeptidase MepM/ murein hydrolase activator NlpD
MKKNLFEYFYKDKKKIKLNDLENYDFVGTFKKKVLFTMISLLIIIIFTSFFLLLKNDVIKFGSTITNNSDLLRIVVPYPNSSINIDDYEINKYKIQLGDNLFTILTKQIGISNEDTNNVLKAIKNVYNVSQLKVGQIIEFRTRILINEKEEIKEKITLDEMKIVPENSDEEILVVLNEKNDYTAKKNKVALNKSYLKYKVKIENSLFADGVRAGISESIMINFIKYYSFDIDFQRDLRKGDTFEVLFEKFYTEDGEEIRDGDILYANLNNQGKDYEIYKFENSYYNRTGQSAKKSLLKTPINGARISSGFGTRVHPILGYTKKHLGKDFAAPRGTPFFAAGSGVVVQAGPFGTFGNYVRIKHQGGYETEYAHASKIAKEIKIGIRVKQGQIIAYVGTTGRSTGPHLHFGVLYNKQRINPDRVKSLPTIKLIGKDLINFQEELKKINLYRQNIPSQNLELRR